MDGLSGIRCEWTGMGAKCKRSSEVHICIERKTRKVSMGTGQGNDQQFLHIKRSIRQRNPKHYCQETRAVSCSATCSASTIS